MSHDHDVQLLYEADQHSAWLDEFEAQYGDSIRSKSRLQALITAAEQLEEQVEDDGSGIAIVDSERLQRVLGFARRNRKDLDSGLL